MYQCLRHDALLTSPPPLILHHHITQHPTNTYSPLSLNELLEAQKCLILMRDDHRCLIDQCKKDLSILQQKRTHLSNMNSSSYKNHSDKLKLLLIDNDEAKKSFQPCKYQQQIRSAQIHAYRAAKNDKSKKQPLSKKNEKSKKQPPEAKGTSQKPTSQKPTSEKQTSEKPTSKKPTSQKPTKKNVSSCHSLIKIDYNLHRFSNYLLPN